jgi:hypothetical protein
VRVFIHLGGALVFCFILWLMVVSPGFRLFGIIVIVGGILLLIIGLSNTGTPTYRAPTLTAEQIAEQRRQAEIQEQREKARWTMVIPSQISTTATLGSGYGCAQLCNAIKLTVRNKSDYIVTGVTLTATIYNCNGQPRPNYTNCDVVGEKSTSVYPNSPYSGVPGEGIPPGQTREFEGNLSFQNAPEPLQGWTRTFSYIVNRVQTKEYEYQSKL